VLTVIEDRVMKGVPITRSDARFLASLSGLSVFDLFASANRIRDAYRGDRIDVCSIINAKSGACSEDCAYCAQSSSSSAAVGIYPLLDKSAVLEKAEEAREGGAKRFCIVTSGRRVSKSEIREISAMISEIGPMGLLPCATLGLLDEQDLGILKDHGLVRYHHNLETSERFFPEICSTHSYKDKIGTIRAVKTAGLSLCSGGIFGLGEDWEDRTAMAFALREIGADSVPVNFLTPISGTRLGNRTSLAPLEALKVISLYRFILPEKEIRVCGGRMQTLGEFNSFIFFAGADGLLSGNYLTTPGKRYEDDLRLIEQCGLRT